MSVFDDELTLPGVITEIISDYSSGYDTSAFGTTDSVTIIGTAFDGPVGIPVPVYSPEHANYIFGAAFDPITRKEASLVAEIQEAWDRGCRTIYAVRVSGKAIYKDFQLASDADCKLRVSGIFPSNKNKDVYFEYVPASTSQEAAFKIYKPAERATIQEKLLGRVDSENSILVNTINLLSSWNVSANSKLVDVIKSFNEYRYNNVLVLSLVDKDGNDITNTVTAQSVAFGDLFPGVYFVGRDKNATGVIAKTDLVSKFVAEEDRASIYESFSGNIAKTLKVNTDVTKDLPIYHSDVTKLNALIGAVPGITMTTLFDFLSVAGKANLLWLKDKVDYEEVDLSDFEMYKKLGSGFVTTANITEVKSGIYKVAEVTNINDTNRIQGITDGIYSMLENLNSDYRVLAGRYADTEIKDKLPKKSEFLISSPGSQEIFAKILNVKAKLDKKDLSRTAKKYQFKLRKLDDASDLLSQDAVIAKLYKHSGEYVVFDYAMETADVATLKVEEFEKDDLILETKSGETTLHKVIDGKFVQLKEKSIYGDDYSNKLIVTSNNLYAVDGTSSTVLKFQKQTTFTNYKSVPYLLGNVRGDIVIFEVTEKSGQAGTIDKVSPLVRLQDVLEESSSTFATIIPEITNNVQHLVELRAVALEVTTLEELITELNDNNVLSPYFSFSVASAVSNVQAQLPVLGTGNTPTHIFVLKTTPANTDIVDTESNKLNGTTGNEVLTDRSTPVYDQSLYIPFKTSDNFARHLAQHCVYTGLKTSYSTHGVIGCSKLMSNNLQMVADKVNKIASIDFNMYAKRPNGNDLLDRNNLPYHIGRAVSITFFQTTVETASNYTYTSTGAASYAGMVSTLPIEQSSTSQPINIANTTFDLTNSQLSKLTQAGIVTVKNSFTQGFVVTDGVTMAEATSPFRRLSVSRIINGVGTALRVAAEPYIGKQNHLANRNSLQTAIKSQLDAMLDNLIERYDFKIVANNENNRLGILEIDYTIVPIYEIREVRNKVTVRDNQ